MNRRRILAWIGILILVSMYLVNLVLALIGSDFAQKMLQVSVICTIAIPIILYGFLMVMKATGADQKVEIVEDEEEEAQE